MLMVTDRRRRVTLLVVPFLLGSLQAQTPNLLFDGVDDQVTLPNGVLNDLGTGPFTVETWVRGTEADQVTHPRILSNRDQIDNGFMLGFHGIWGGSAYKMLCLQLDGLNYILINNGTYNGSILDGTCHHVAVSKGLDSLRFYVDGAHIGSKVLQGNPSAATSALSMLVGNDGPDPQPFQGNISQVRLWDFVRTQAEIQADLNYSIPGSTPGLLGYWELNEGVGQTITDETNTSNGSLGSVGTADVSDPTWINDGCELDPLHASLEQWNAPSVLQVHPNPAQGQVQVELPEYRAPAELVIMDLTSRTVLFARLSGQQRTTLDVSHLNESVYLLHLRDGKTRRALRFVKDP
ncbi:MAG: T9SS type A sorting domain-containing protein [Flavobacteriales bacterium]|nr:T9SS type A sorting domain-containing protein [Flavobacteriales bacterium]